MEGFKELNIIAHGVPKQGGADGLASGFVVAFNKYLRFWDFDAIEVVEGDIVILVNVQLNRINMSRLKKLYWFHNVRIKQYWDQELYFKWTPTI